MTACHIHERRDMRQPCEHCARVRDAILSGEYDPTSNNHVLGAHAGNSRKGGEWARGAKPEHQHPWRMRKGAKTAPPRECEVLDIARSVRGVAT